MGIDFADTIVVRRVVNKGTKVIKETKPVMPKNFQEEMQEQQLARLKLAGDMMIMSAKGTKKIRLSDLEKTKPVLPKGHYIVTGKGTGRIKL